MRDLKGKTMIRPNKWSENIFLQFPNYLQKCLSCHLHLNYLNKISFWKINKEEQLFKGCHINDFSCLQIHDQVIEISRYGNWNQSSKQKESCTILWSNIYSENWSFPMFPPTFRVLVWFKAVLLAICKFWRWIKELKFCHALKIIPINWRMCKKWRYNTIILFLE